MEGLFSLPICDTDFPDGCCCALLVVVVLVVLVVLVVVMECGRW